MNFGRSTTDSSQNRKAISTAPSTNASSGKESTSRTIPTQMGEFDFISVLISLIIGLGIPNLVSGAGRVFYRRRRNPIDEVHMVLTVATLLILVLNWWVSF